MNHELSYTCMLTNEANNKIKASRTRVSPRFFMLVPTLTIPITPQPTKRDTIERGVVLLHVGTFEALKVLDPSFNFWPTCILAHI
mmetsp:Transcript_44756/g.80213  ORF Transcript_44756/g.80213 Transcript_44756/m.80213 type:complete len:85 (+) Transcript_44756:460-714(+)